MNNIKNLYNPMNKDYQNLHISIFDSMMKSIERADDESSGSDISSISEDLFESTKLHSLLI